MDQLQQYSRFPLPVAKEAILLQVLSKFHLKCYHLLQQYAVDCRIDECIQAFLTELLVCVALPHNPYSTLMSLLKQYHWRYIVYLCVLSFDVMSLVVDSVYINRQILN